MLLPLEVLRRRISTEIEMLRKSGMAIVERVETSTIDFPAKLTVRIRRDNDSPVVFEIEIPREYPFRRPSVLCMSEILHPNISPASEGGIVCTKLLEEWRVERTLQAIVAGLLELLRNPNYREPLGTETCIKAAEMWSAGNACQGN
jgi:ubiquitin-protein ligase